MRVFLTLVSPALIIACSALLAIRAGVRAEQKAFYLFRPLTTLLILLYALMAVQGFGDKRGLVMVAGLALALLADVALMLPRKFGWGLLLFSGVHTAYGVAFWTGFSQNGLFIALPLALLCLLLGGVWRKLADLKAVVSLYLLSLWFMLHQIVERYSQLPDLSGVVALFGGGLLALSAVLFILSKCFTAFKAAQWFGLASYVAAQYLIVLSFYVRFG